ncbi:MAG: MFS transporter [Gammaproteobacteria bacterium]|jgi:MFS family permease|nr:MFS transporter [Gammaproteobacteria bacterium]MBT5216824.1 MFS transporter [Gammaproteobacteria bacterium]MBT5542140.1 MFS transporter [Gammaproteobacteria bacterium]MBT6073520.1 MFS transporter [Gammaproteobacteria bacterium]MBT7753121.1 MFS transporter [Gammaproteobacteria bacterium]
MSQSSSYQLLGFLTTLNVLNFIDRQLLTSFSNFIVPDLNLTNTQFGLLSGLAFIVFYSLVGLFMGAISDRVHRIKFISFGVFLWSLLTAISGMAKNFWMLLLPRIFIGIGESILTPSALSLLSDHFPKKNMGFVSGFYYLAVPLGITASFYIAGYLGPIWGWRNCFFALGAIGIIFAIVILIFKETPNRKQQLELQLTKDVLNKKTIIDSMHALRQTLKDNYALRLTIYGGIAVHLILGATTFDQLWLVQERGFDRSEILIITGTIGFPAGILGNLFGGIGSDYYTKVTGKARQTFLFWCLLVFTPFVIYYRLTEDTGILFFSLLFLGFFQWGCLYGPITSSIQEMAPEKMRAIVLAYYLLMVNIVGLGIGITFAGVMIDYLLSNGVNEAYSKTLLTFQLLAGLSLPAFYIAGKNYKPNNEEKRV